MPELDPIKQKIVLDLKEFKAALGESIRQMQSLSKFTAEVSEAVKRLAKHSHETAGMIAGAGGLSAALRVAIDLSKEFASKIGESIRHMRAFADVQRDAQRATTALQAVERAATHATESFSRQSRALQTTAEQMGAVSTQAHRVEQSMRRAHGVFHLVGSVIASFVLPLVSSLASALADRLSPDLSAFATSAEHISQATQNLRLRVTELTQAFIEGQRRAINPIKEALVALVNAIIPASDGFARLAGSASKIISIAMSMVSWLASITANLSAIGGIIAGAQLVAGTKIFQSLASSMNATATAASGLGQVIVLLTKLITVGLKAAIVDILTLIKSIVPGVQALSSFIAKLVATIGGGGVAGVLLAAGATLVGSLLLAKRALSDVSSEIAKSETFFQRLNRLSRDLGTSIEASFRQAASAIRDFILERGRLLEVPGVSRAAIGAGITDQLRQLDVAAKQFKDQLKNIPELTREQVRDLSNAYEHMTQISRELAKQIGMHQQNAAGLQEQVQRVERQVRLQHELLDAERNRLNAALQSLEVQRQQASAIENAELKSKRLLEIDKQEIEIKRKLAAVSQSQVELERSRIEQVEKLIRAAQRQSIETERNLSVLRQRFEALGIEQSEIARRIDDITAKQEDLRAQGKDLSEADQRRLSSLKAQEEAVRIMRESIQGVLPLLERQGELYKKQAEDLYNAKEQLKAQEELIARTNESLAMQERLITDPLRRALEAIERRYKILQEQVEVEQANAQAAVRSAEAKAEEAKLAKDVVSATELARKATEERAAAERQLLEAHRRALELELRRLQEIEQTVRRFIAEGTVREEEYADLLREVENRKKAITEQLREQNAQAQQLASHYEQILRSLNVGLAAIQQQIVQLNRSLEIESQRAQLVQSSLSIERELVEIRRLALDPATNEIKLRKQELQIDRDILAIEQKLLTERKRALDKQIVDYEKLIALQTKRVEILEREVGAGRESAETLAEARHELEQSKLALDGLHLSVQQANAGLQATASRLAAINTQFERLDQVAINFGDVFVNAVSSGFEAVVLGTRRLVDVFEGMKASVLQIFATMFAEMIKRKIAFDTVWQRNWLVELPGAVQIGIGKAVAAVGHLLGGNLAQASNGFLGAVGSLLSTRLGGAAAMTVAGSLLGGSLFGPSSSGFGTALMGAGLIAPLLPGFSLGGSLSNLWSNLSLLPEAIIRGDLGAIFGQGGILSSAFGGIGGLIGLGGALFGGGPLAGRLLTGLGGALSLGASGMLGAGLAGMLGAIPGLQFLAPLFMIGGGLLGSLFQPGRIEMEKRSIEQLLEQVFGFNVPRKDTQKFLPAARTAFADVRGGLEALGTSYALVAEEGGIGTIKRFANLAQAAFQEAGVSIEEAKRKVLELARAMGYDLHKAITDVNRALDGGFKDKKNQLSLAEYMEEVREGQKDIVSLNTVLKGALDVVTGFSDAVDTAKVANKILGDEFERTAKETGLFNDEIKGLAQAIRDGQMTIEQAAIRLNELRKAQGLAALELKDFKIAEIEVVREFVKMGIAIDETSAKVLQLVGALDALDQQMKQIDERIKQINDSIKALEIEKLQRAFDIETTLAEARGMTPSRRFDLMRQWREQVFLPSLGKWIGADLSGLLPTGPAPPGIVATLDRGPGGAGTTITTTAGGWPTVNVQPFVDFLMGRTGQFDLTTLSLPQLQQLQAGLGQLQQHLVQSFQTALQAETERITAHYNALIEGVTKRAEEAAQALRSAAEAEAEAARQAAKAQIEAHQARIEQLQQEAKAIQEAARERLEALQKEMQIALAFQRLAESLKQQIDALVAGPASPLTQPEQFGYLMRRAEEIRRKMATATREERAQLIPELQGILQQLLQQSPFQLPAAEYRALFDAIVKELEQLRREADAHSARAKAIEEEMLDVQKRLEQDLERIEQQIQAEREAIERVQEELSARLDAINKQLQADLEALNRRTEEEVRYLQRLAEQEIAAVRERLAAELEKQLRALQEIQDAVTDRIIQLMEEERSKLERDRERLLQHYDRIEQQIAELLQIERNEVAAYLRQIRDSLAGRTTAQHGFRGVVSPPGKLFHAGEAGAEYVEVTPLHRLAAVGKSLVAQQVTEPPAHARLAAAAAVAPVTVRTDITVNVPQGAPIDEEGLAQRIATIAEQRMIRSLRYGQARTMLYSAREVR